MRKLQTLNGACAVVLLLLATFNGCQSERSQPASVSEPAAPGPSERGPRHDLSEDEAEGGHTLKKHVGRTDTQLEERLKRERNISAASTYTDRETAERVIGIALQQGQPRIRGWLDRQSGHPNLVLDYDGDADHPIGRTLRRGEDHTQPCSRAVVVLKYSGDYHYYVLTSYPECK